MVISKVYYVIPSDMALQLDINSLEAVSYESIRTSSDGSLSIVEYNGPVDVNSGTFYTYEEAYALMQTPEWASPDDVP